MKNSVIIIFKLGFVYAKIFKSQANIWYTYKILILKKVDIFIYLCILIFLWIIEIRLDSLKIFFISVVLENAYSKEIAEVSKNVWEVRTIKCSKI